MSEEDIKAEKEFPKLDLGEIGDKQILQELIRGNNLVFQLWEQTDRLLDGSRQVRIMMAIIIFLLVIITFQLKY